MPPAVAWFVALAVVGAQIPALLGMLAVLAVAAFKLIGGPVGFENVMQSKIEGITDDQRQHR